MMWLQLLDFRFVEYDMLGQSKLHRRQLAAAHRLYDAINRSGQRETWNKIEPLP
jgi:hypothetical protein